jgi:predicted TIM-barrel fold metal-dependent hydrolase
MMDVDSHEMVPSPLWGQEFGEVAERIRPYTNGIIGMAAENTLNREDILDDTSEITPQSVWNVKGPGAPSALDLKRRPAVLDAMGVERQLVFPTFGLLGMALKHNPLAPQVFGFDPDEFDRIEVGQAIITAHNQWASRIVKEVGRDRIRPVGIVDTSTFETMMSDAEAAISGGVPVLWISGGTPPADTSPGDTMLDPFYRLLAEANVPLTLHIGTEFGLLRSSNWSKGVPQFTPSTGSSLEFAVEPFRSSTLHLAPDNFLSAMVLGGVFERHPTLRFGVIECSAHWVGPLAEQLDMWFDEFHKRLAPHLSMRPSEYIARNVRATPFYFEPVDEYMERYPKVASVYCYSSDFPHREGGKESARVFWERMRRLDPSLAQKFYVTNGELLLPA